MGRNPKPTAELQANGTMKKHPGRYAERTKNEPTEIAPLGDPPAHLTAPVKAAFREIVATIPPGVAWKSDRLTIELAAMLLTEVRASPTTVPAARLTRLQSLLASLGLSPVDRTRVSIKPPPGAPAPEGRDPARFFKH